jgi:hypothetical protein
MWCEYITGNRLDSKRGKRIRISARECNDAFASSEPAFRDAAAKITAAEN